MLIAKLFLPMSTPGLAALGLGVVGVANGTYNIIEVIAIVLGLLVVAVAGIFTIRSNVAKIWREQAEGEKARNLDLTAQMAELVKEHADDLAAAKIVAAEHEAHLLKVMAELEAANLRTDMNPVLDLLKEIKAAVMVGPVEVTGEHGGPVKVEQAKGGL